jgi:hypothetical protein
VDDGLKPEKIAVAEYRLADCIEGAKITPQNPADAGEIHKLINSLIEKRKTVLAVTPQTAGQHYMKITRGFRTGASHDHQADDLRVEVQARRCRMDSALAIPG